MLTRGLTSARQAAAEAASKAAMLGRLTRDLPAWLRSPMSLDEAQARVRRQLARREESFLSALEHAIYRYPRSPYLKLLRHAGCEIGDVRALVAREGLEAALRILADRGVYVTFDELKGLREAVRGSARFHFEARDFDSPLTAGHYVTYTGGTRGQPVQIPRPLPYVEELTTG
jgi:hypothetical protein